MITTAGRILSLDSVRVMVECHRARPCVACPGCAEALICDSRKATPATLDAFIGELSTPLRVGDEVEIGLADRDLLRASVTVYLLPLLGLTTASMLGSSLAAGQDDLPVMAAGLAGLMLGWLASAALARWTHLTPKAWVLGRVTSRSPDA